MTIDSDKGEHLSSFIDGELERDHCETLISSICKDEDMKSCLTRYQMISDSMKNQLPDGIKHDFAQRVMTAIESEPTVFAPTFTATAPNNTSPASSSKSKDSIPGKVIHFPSITKKVAGFAIAASVATIAVIGVQTQNQDPSTKVVAMPENSEFVRLQKESRPMTASVNPLRTPQQSSDGPMAASSTMSQQTIPQLKPVRKFDPKLQQYIVNHSQYASGVGANDIVSHARIVASTQNRQNTDQVQR